MSSIKHHDVDELLDIFFNKNKVKSLNRPFLELKKGQRKKVINYVSNEKVMTIHLIVGLMLMIFHEKKMFFPKNIVVLVWWKIERLN